MMLVYRFVRLIEERSDAPANGLLHKVQRSLRTEAYHNVLPDELKQRVYEIYHHPGEWLLVKSEADIEQRYIEIGSRRAHQGVSLSHLIWAIIPTKGFLPEHSARGERRYSNKTRKMFDETRNIRRG